MKLWRQRAAAEDAAVPAVRSSLQALLTKLEEAIPSEPGREHSLALADGVLVLRVSDGGQFYTFHVADSDFADPKGSIAEIQRLIK